MEIFLHGTNNKKDMVGNMRFPAQRAWEHGPRRLHITKWLTMEIDYKEKELLYVAKLTTSDAGDITVYINSILDVKLPADNGVYHFDLAQDIYKVYKNGDLQTVIMVKEFNEDGKLEKYVDLKLVADYS